MRTINTKLNTIRHYRLAYNVIRDYFPVELAKLNDEQKSDLNGVDDYEDFGYTVINDETVIMDDDGDVLAVESLQEFLRKTLEFIGACADGRKEGGGA